MKTIFRYKKSSACLFIGLVIAFLALYYGNRSQLKLQNAVIEKNGNIYRHEIMATYYGDTFNANDIPILEKGNCTVEGLYLMLDDAQIITGINVVLYSNEMLHIPIFEGTWPSNQELQSNEPVAVVGIGYKKYTFTQGDYDYINIQGEKYRITGYIGGKSDEYDMYVMLFASNMGTIAYDLLCADCNTFGVNILFQSDNYNMQEELSNVSEILSKSGAFSVVSSESNMDVYVSVERDGTFFWVYAYCGGICILVSVFWIIERRRELVIRRAFGFTNRQLICILLRELLGIIGFSICFGMLIISIINFSGNDSFNYLNDEVRLIILTILAYIITITIITMIYPIVSVLKKLPALDMNKKEI